MYRLLLLSKNNRSMKQQERREYELDFPHGSFFKTLEVYSLARFTDGNRYPVPYRVDELTGFALAVPYTVGNPSQAAVYGIVGEFQLVHRPSFILAPRPNTKRDRASFLIN